MLIFLILAGSLVLAFAVTAVSIAVTDHIKDVAYTQGFDAGFTWGERTVHIRSHSDLFA